MLAPNNTPKAKKHLPHRTKGLVVPIERLMAHYSKVPEVKLKAHKTKTRGKRTGHGICRFMFEVFRQNELLPRSDKLTNERIRMMLLEEFPDQEALHRGLETGGKGGVNDFRRRYNSGTLLRDVLPERCSFRYNSQGLAVDTRNGRKVLSVQDQAAIWERYRSKFTSVKQESSRGKKTSQEET